MNKILIIYAHPSPRRSVFNKALKKAITGIEGVTVHDLYACYPDSLIGIQTEQDLCSQHDTIIFQHPLFWYSFPALMKEWLDSVLEHNWAYGPLGTALKDKYFLHAISAGGDRESYSKSGSNGFTIQEFLQPSIATAKLCSLLWLPPFVVFDAHKAIAPGIVTQHAEEYRKLILALRDDKVNLTKARKLPIINDNLDKLIEEI